jgi:hypothetical protein
MIRSPVTVPPAVRQNVVAELSIARDVGSVLWMRTPVSPVTPFRVMDWVLVDGGMMVAQVGTLPKAGIVMVLAPAVRVWRVMEPALEVFEAATIFSVPVTSSVNVIEMYRVLVTDMSDSSYSKAIRTFQGQ